MSKEEIQVTRSDSCSTISGRGSVSYEIGILGDQQFIRLGKSDNGGLCCREWIALTDIQKLISDNPNLTSKILRLMYAGKSSNSPAFLLAVLIHEEMCSVGSSIPLNPVSESGPPSKVIKKKKAKKGLP